jgi:hypothetical protein
VASVKQEASPNMHAPLGVGIKQEEAGTTTGQAVHTGNGAAQGGGGNAVAAASAHQAHGGRQGAAHAVPTPPQQQQQQQHGPRGAARPLLRTLSVICIDCSDDEAGPTIAPQHGGTGARAGTSTSTGAAHAAVDLPAASAMCMQPVMFMQAVVCAWIGTGTAPFDGFG